MTAAAPTVVLVHGLWMNRAAMLYLARALAARGFRTRTAGYFSTLHDFEHNAARLARVLEAAERDGAPAHVVAHSLGGLVALRALERLPPRPGRRAVLLAAPVNACRAGAELARARWFRPLLGTTAALWSRMPRLVVPPGVEAGAIAGTRTLGLARLLVKLPAPSDGAVMVEETRHPQLADHLVMPVAHSEVLVSPAVARQCAAFLARGRFERGDAATARARR